MWVRRRLRLLRLKMMSKLECCSVVAHQVAHVSVYSEEMAWRAKSRSRSRAGQVMDMDWRSGSRSRSRVRSRLSLPSFDEYKEEATSTATAQDTAAAGYMDDATFYDGLFVLPPMANESLGEQSHSVQQTQPPMSAPLDFSDMFGMSVRNSPKLLPQSTRPAHHQASYRSDSPKRQNGSVAGLRSEQSLRENHHAEFGFLPKIVRKTSFDEAYAASLLRNTFDLSQSSSQQVDGLSTSLHNVCLMSRLLYSILTICVSRDQPTINLQVSA